MLLHLGNVPTLVISSAEAAKQVLKTHDLDLCSRPPSAGIGRLSYNYLDISFAPYGEYCREVRKLCVLELFSVKRVQSFGTSRAEEVAAMNDSTSESAVSSTPVDISRKLLSLTEQIIFKVAFGMTDKREQLGNFETIIFEAINMLSSFSATDYFPGVGWIIDRLTGLHGTLEKSFHDLDTFYQKIIDEHLDTQRLKSGHEDIIDVLLKLERDGLNSVNLTKDHIKATLMETEVQVENQQEHEQDEQNRQQQNSNVSSVRVSFTMISDWSSPELMDDVWQCIISLLICWFLAVSLMVVVGFNGKRDWPIGPNFSRLLTANSLFVSEIIVIAEGYYPTISCWFFRRESKKKHMKLFLVLLK